MESEELSLSNSSKSGNKESDPHLHQILSSSEDLLARDSLPACGIVSKILEDNGPREQKITTRTSTSHYTESISLSEKTAQHIVDELVGTAVPDKPIIKIKKPIKTSGWMDFSEIIPDFNINDEVFRNMIFHENLVISIFEAKEPYPTPVGALSLDIQSGRGGPLNYQKKKTKADFVYPKFLVHLSSQLDFNGHNAGSRILAWVDRDLRTLEENRKEYVCLEDGTDEQSLYINSQETFYYLRCDKKNEIFYTPAKAKNLICEGASFVLMRYLAITRFVGTFEVSTVYLNGNLCRNVYNCKGPTSGIVNNTKLDVCKISRTIVEECGIEHRSISLFTLQG